MTRTEALLLHVLAWMCSQYLHDRNCPQKRLEGRAAGAGVTAIALLEQRCFVEPDTEGWRWTDAGRALLDMRDIRPGLRTLKPSDLRALPEGEGERWLLKVLADVCDQYMGENGYLDHMYMSAGEEAVEVLAIYGLVDSFQRDCRWTEVGKALLAAD